MIIPIRVQRPDQGGDGGDMGGGHRRAGAQAVVVAGVGTQDVHAGGGDGDGSLAEVGESGQLVVAIGGRDRDDVVQFEVGRVGRLEVGVAATVACGRDEQVSLALSYLDGVEQRGRVAAVVPTIVRYLDVVGQRQVEAVDELRHRAAAAVVEELDRDQLGVPVDAGDADAVVAYRPDRAGHMGAVAVAVQRVIVVGVAVPTDEIVDVAATVLRDAVGPPPHSSVVALGVLDQGCQQVAPIDVALVVVVGDLADTLIPRVIQITHGDEAVVVIVHEVLQPGGGNLLLIDPNVQVEILVGIVDSGVEHGDGNLFDTVDDIPRGRGADIRPRRAAVLPGVLQVILLAELRVVRDRRRAQVQVGLGVIDVAVLAVGG